jgi:hypothetical protein
MTAKSVRGSKGSRGSRGGRGTRGSRGFLRGVSAPRSTRYARFDQEFQAQLDYEDEILSEKENIEFLAIVNGAPEEVAETKAGPSKRLAPKRKYEETLDYEEEDEDYEFEAEMKPTRAYNAKKQTADAICSQYIDAFKRSNDLKLNEYFRILNETVKDSVLSLTKEVNVLNSYFRNNSWSGQDKGVKTSRKRIKLEKKEEDAELIEIDISSQEYIDSKLSPSSTVTSRKSSRKAIPELPPAQSPLRRVEPEFERAQSPLRRVEPEFERAQSPLRRVEPEFERAQSPLRRVEPEFERAQSPLRRVEPMLKRARSPLRQVQPTMKQETQANPQSSLKTRVRKTEPDEESGSEEKHQEISFLEFNKIVSQSRNHTSCATSLLKALFKRSELTSDANVTGLLSSGLRKEKLDPLRIKAIKNASVDRKPTGVSDDEAWNDCIKAIHKLQYDLREERRSFDYQ